MISEFGEDIYLGARIKISKKSINVNVSVLFEIRAKYIKKPFFCCKAHIKAIITMEIIFVPKTKGKVNDFNSKIEQVYIFNNLIRKIQ